MWDTYQVSLALAVVLVSLVLVWRSWCPASLMDCTSMWVACCVGKTLLQTAGRAAHTPSLQKSDAVLWGNVVCLPTPHLPFSLTMGWLLCVIFRVKMGFAQGRVERSFLLNKLYGPGSSWVKQHQWHLLDFFHSGRKWPPWPVLFCRRHLVCSLAWTLKVLFCGFCWMWELLFRMSKRLCKWFNCAPM